MIVYAKKFFFVVLSKKNISLINLNTSEIINQSSLASWEILCFFLTIYFKKFHINDYTVDYREINRMKNRISVYT